MPNTELENFSKKIESGEVTANEERIIVAPKPTESPAPANSIIDDDDVVIAGMDVETLKTEAASTTPVLAAVDAEIADIVTENMKEFAAADPEHYTNEHDKIVSDACDYRRKLVVDQGLSEEEAEAASKARARKEARKANEKYAKDAAEPDVVVVKIDKTQTDKVEFTDEEKAKMTKAKAIRLVEVEDSSLLNIPIKTSDSDDVLFNAIHKASCSVSRYTMPMINTYDNCEFTGATTMQLISAVYDESDSDYRRYQEQLELIYTKFQGSTLMDKYDIEGNTIMTKEDFAKWFRFFDMPVALYAVYVASATENITSQFKCDACEKEYDFEYNTKKLISYPDIPEKFQADLDTVLSLDADRDGLAEAKEKSRRGKRFKSQFTNNIYDISSPSVARALNVLRYVNPRDTYARYLSLYAMMFDTIYVYDSSDKNYIPITADNPRAILSFLYDIIDTELKLITKVVNDFYYVPTFRIKRKCPVCGNEEEETFSIDQLVFLKAQGSEAEIE